MNLKEQLALFLRVNRFIKQVIQDHRKRFLIYNKIPPNLTREVLRNILNKNNVYRRVKSVPSDELISAFKNPDNLLNRNILIEGCRTGDIDLVHLCVEMDFNLNIQDESGLTPLMWAIREKSDLNNKNNAIALLLIKSGALINLQDSNGVTALMWAVSSKNYSIVKALKKARADLTITDNVGYTANMHLPNRGDLGVFLKILHILNS